MHHVLLLKKRITKLKRINRHTRANERLKREVMLASLKGMFPGKRPNWTADDENGGDF